MKKQMIKVVAFFAVISILSLGIPYCPVIGAPSTPTGLTATVDPNSGIVLSWGEVSGATSYIVTCNGSDLATVTTNQYTHSSFSYNTSYTYTVRAHDSSGDSAASNTVKTYAPQPQEVDYSTIYTDSYQSGFSYGTSATFGAKLEDDTTYYVNGSKSQKATFSSNYGNASIKSGSSMNFTNLRTNGAFLSFWVYAPTIASPANTAMNTYVMQINLWRSYTDPSTGKGAALRTKVYMSNYTSGYDAWKYVKIPIADFPSTGSYSVSGTTYNNIPFDFTDVTGIDIISTSTAAVIYFDDISIKTYKGPQVSKVVLGSGKTLVEGDVVPRDSTVFKITFDMTVDPNTVNTNNIGVTYNGIPMEGTGAYDSASKTYTLTLTYPLNYTDSYRLVVGGIKSVSGTEMTDQPYILTFRAKNTFDVDSFILKEGTQEAAVLKTSTTYSAVAEIHNVTGESQKAVIFIGLYNPDGTLRSTKMATRDIGDNETSLTFQVDYSVPADISTNSKLKAFLWEDTTKMKPLSSNIVISK